MMSIGAIDTQIMIVRLLDRVWEASAEQKRVERSQEFHAHLGKTISAKERSRVNATSLVEMDSIRAKIDGHVSEGNGGNGGYALGRYKESELIDQDLVVPAGENKIDIMV